MSSLNPAGFARHRAGGTPALRDNYLPAHTGLGITEGDWAISVKALGATLDKFKVPAREQQDVIGAIASLKSQMVGK